LQPLSARRPEIPLHKLPVFATAREVYAFLWRERGAILRLSWFSLLVVTIIGFFAMRARMDSFREMVASGTAARAMKLEMSGFSYLELVNQLVTIAGVAIVAVALHRVILFNDRQPGSFVNFNFGKVEGLFVLLPVLFYAGFAVLAAAIGFVLGGLPPGALFIVTFGIVGTMLFLIVRYVLVFPIAVVERSYNFLAAWSLSHENFWRLIGLWAVVSIPFGILFLLIFVTHTLLLPGSAFNPGSGAGMLGMIDEMEDRFMRIAVLSYPASIIYVALGVGTLSYSYKALAGLRPDEVVQGAG